MKIEKAFLRLWKEVDQGNRHQVKAIKDLAIGLQQYELASAFRDVERGLEKPKQTGWIPSITIEELVGGPQWYLNGEPIDTVEARHNFIVDKINAEQRYNKTIPNRD